MDPVPAEDRSAQGSPMHGAVPVERVLVVRLNEAVPTTPDAAKSARTTSATGLEWVKAVGMPLTTVLVTLIGGAYFTDLAKSRESRESNDRLYAQLLTQREQSDALIRKDMFGVVISRFLADPKTEDWSSRVLQLELLANNFHQSLDLAPLFKDLARRLPEGNVSTQAQHAELKKRLDVTAGNLILKQVNSLARRGYVREQTVPLADWKASVGTPFIDVSIPRTRLAPSMVYAPAGDKEQINFAVEVVGVDVAQRELEVRLRVDFPGDEWDVDRHFWVGQYDFPMLDNTQLPYGLRTSVVITEFFVPETHVDREANSFVKFHLVVFPAAAASFKERQDYDDILLDMLRVKGEPPRGG